MWYIFFSPMFTCAFLPPSSGLKWNIAEHAGMLLPSIDQKIAWYHCLLFVMHYTCVGALIFFVMQPNFTLILQYDLLFS